MNTAARGADREATPAELRSRLERITVEGLEGPGADRAATQLEELVDAIESFLHAEATQGEAAGNSPG